MPEIPWGELRTAFSTQDPLRLRDAFQLCTDAELSPEALEDLRVYCAGKVRENEDLLNIWPLKLGRVFDLEDTYKAFAPAKRAGCMDYAFGDCYHYGEHCPALIAVDFIFLYDVPNTYQGSGWDLIIWEEVKSALYYAGQKICHKRSDGMFDYQIRYLDRILKHPLEERSNTLARLARYNNNAGRLAESGTTHKGFWLRQMLYNAAQTGAASLYALWQVFADLDESGYSPECQEQWERAVRRLALKAWDLRHVNP